MVVMHLILMSATARLCLWVF